MYYALLLCIIMLVYVFAVVFEISNTILQEQVLLKSATMTERFYVTRVLDTADLHHPQHHPPLYTTSSTTIHHCDYTLYTPQSLTQ